MKSINKLSCFKAYDIRGKIPEELNEDLAYKIGLAYCQLLKPNTVIVGYDIRLESIPLSRALVKGITDAGSNVINIGLCGTEEVYFHCFDNHSGNIDGGIMITASHNPKGYNGMKLVGKGAKPMSLSDDLQKIHDIILQNKFITNSTKGSESLNFDKSSYISHLYSYINPSSLKPLKIVVNPGNGPAGLIIKLLEEYLPFQFIYLNNEPDGNFPNGVPNPMIIENREITSQAVRQHRADLGIAWDGDFDRCFVFDENGNFIEGYYIVGMLAESFLKKHPGEKIVHDPRLIWNTLDVVEQYKGIAIESKSGHSFIKDVMRKQNAIYGGEMSAHHYFREFGYCDSGMIPWLLISELVSTSGFNLSAMINSQITKFPCSGEINFVVDDPAAIIEKVEKHYTKQVILVNKIDGISMNFENWRMNLRMSNTEPLIRLNIETKGNAQLVGELIEQIKMLITAL